MLAQVLSRFPDWDPAARVPLNGAALAAASIALDVLVLVLHYLIKRFVDNRNFSEITQLRAELATINPKKEFPRYSKLERRIARLKRTLKPEYQAPLVLRILRTYVVPALLMRKWVCEVPRAFFAPFNRAVAFPLGVDGETVRVGFSFFWVCVTRATNAAYRALTGSTV